MSVTYSFISTLYLKQQTKILRCFCSLKFENSLFSNKLFRCIFRSGRFIQLKFTQLNILFKTSSLKSHFSLCKLLLDFATTATNYADFATTAIN